jgi:hypothetical protein
MSEDIAYEKWAFTDHAPRGPWQGTRNCPRDGTIFLIWRNADQRVRCASISENGKWNMWCDGVGVLYKPEALPDYWMPWPDAPETFPIGLSH